MRSSQSTQRSTPAASSGPSSSSRSSTGRSSLPGRRNCCGSAKSTGYGVVFLHFLRSDADGKLRGFRDSSSPLRMRSRARCSSTRARRIQFRSRSTFRSFSLILEPMQSRLLRRCTLDSARIYSKWMRSWEKVCFVFVVWFLQTKYSCRFYVLAIFICPTYFLMRAFGPNAFKVNVVFDILKL
jgi:hypothetical protein